MKQVKWKFPLRSFAVAGSLLLSAVAFAQSGGLKGQVKDATGEPIIGATIMANGKAVGVTDFDGNYVINVPKGTELTITYVGMSPKKVIAADNLSTTLQDDNKTLNEVVVIGYGAVKKSDLTGSVAQLQPDGKNRGLVVNAQDLMQGKMAGVSITTGGGTPGSGASIRIRGGSSLNASNDPLIVIDGVPMDNNGVPNGDKGIQGMANPLSMVNPQDIESFNVLKDASATAIYGSRGSNGVIIITTKRGHANQPVRVSYAGNMTLSTRRSFESAGNGEYRLAKGDLSHSIEPRPKHHRVGVAGVRRIERLSALACVDGLHQSTRHRENLEFRALYGRIQSQSPFAQRPLVV